MSINSDSNWIDPASMLLYFKVNNKDGTPQTPTTVTRMEPLGQAHMWIQRLRVLCQGILVEQIDDYNRLYELLLRQTSEDYQRQYAAMGFGLKVTNPSDYTHLRGARRIKPGDGKTVCCPLLAGLCLQHRFLPSQYMNLVFEITVADANDVCRGGQVLEGAVTTVFTNTAYDISDVILKCDSITLDSQLQEEYAKKLLSSSLSLSMKCFHHTNYSQTGDQDSVTIAMSRSLSRLCTVYVSFYSTSISPALNKVANYFPHTQGDIDSLLPADETHPLYGVDTTPDSHGIQDEFVCEGVRYPTTPVLTTVEAYANCVRALGMLGQTSHAFGVTGRGYESNDCFCIIGSFEKVIGAAMTGKNLRGGSQLLLNLKNLAPTGIPDTDKITKVFIAAQYDVILEISAASGVVVLE